MLRLGSLNLFILLIKLGVNRLDILAQVINLTLGIFQTLTFFVEFCDGYLFGLFQGLRCFNLIILALFLEIDIKLNLLNGWIHRFGKFVTLNQITHDIFCFILFFICSLKMLFNFADNLLSYF